MNKAIDRDNEMITMDNIQKIGKKMAICAVRGFARISGDNRLHKLRASMIRDIHNKDNIDYVLSDGYDIIQESVCFLLEHIGERLNDKTCKGYHGEIITVKIGCYRHLGNLFERSIREKRKHDSLETFEYNEPFTLDIEYDEERAQQEQAVDDTIERMNLKPEEYETLQCYMAGMGYVEIAKHFAVQLTTIWYRRQRIRKKYNAITSKDI